MFQFVRLAFLLQWRRFFPPLAEARSIASRIEYRRHAFPTELRAAEELEWASIGKDQHASTLQSSKPPNSATKLHQSDDINRVGQ